MANGQIDETVAFLGDLYAKQLALGDNEFLRPRARPAVRRRYAEAFELYRDSLRPGRLLDWGCRHAASACLVKRELGDRVEAHGCDTEELWFEAFYRYAELSYLRLTHPFRLPYADGYFETVIGNGVLEHVSHPRESLGELHRVLAPGGTLVITFLPNLLSYTELANSLLGRTHHDRRYSRRRIRGELRAAGFEPVADGFHQLLPSLVSDGGGGALGRPRVRGAIDRLYRANHRLERVPVLGQLAANIYVIARRNEAAGRAPEG